MDHRDIVTAYMDLVRGIAVQVRKSIGGHYELDELIALGTTGLLESAQRYDARRGIPFPVFARMRVRGAMYDGVRKMMCIPREHRPACRKGSGDRADEVETDEWTDAPVPGEPRATASPSDAWGMSSEQLIDPDAQPADELLVQEIMKSEVHRALEALPEPEQHIIRCHYFDDKTMREAGEELGLSRSWSSRLHARAVDHLRILLNDL